MEGNIMIDLRVKKEPKIVLYSKDVIRDIIGLCEHDSSCIKMTPKLIQKLIISPYYVHTERMTSTRDWDASIAEYYFELTPIRVVVLPVVVSDTPIYDEIVFLKDPFTKQLCLPNAYITDHMLVDADLHEISCGNRILIQREPRMMLAIYRAIVEAICDLPFVMMGSWVDTTPSNSIQTMQQLVTTVCEKMASRLYSNMVESVQNWNYAFQYADVTDDVSEATMYVRVPINYQKDSFDLSRMNITLRAGDGDYEIKKVNPLETRNFISRNHYKLLKTLR